MYIQGRNPFYLEPAVIIALTDGGKYMRNGVNSCDIEEVVRPVIRCKFFFKSKEKRLLRNSNLILLEIKF